MNDTIETLAGKIAEKILEWNKKIDVPKESLQYYLSLWINYYGVLLFCLIIGLIFGKFFVVITVFYAFVTLRALSGGLHATSLTHCFIITSTFVLISSFYPYDISFIFKYFIILINLQLIFWYTNAQRQDTLIASLVLIIICGFAQSSLVIISLTQCLSLIDSTKEVNLHERANW